MEINEAFIQGLLADKVQKVKDKIISGQITLSDELNNNKNSNANELSSTNSAIMNIIFNKYRMDIVNKKKTHLNSKINQYNQKLKDISQRKEEDETNYLKCYHQPIKSKQIKTHCKLLNEEEEDYLQSNAHNFIKRINKDKLYREKKVIANREKNLYNYIQQWKKSSELNIKQKEYEKKKHELQKKLAFSNNNNRNINIYPYKNSVPSLINNESHSYLSNKSSIKIKSPSLGVCCSPAVLKKDNTHNILKDAGVSLIGYNDHYIQNNANTINNSYHSSHSIQYMNLEVNNKNVIQITNQRRSPYYFNEPKYHLSNEVNEKKNQSDRTNSLIID